MKNNTFTDQCFCKQHRLKYQLPKGTHRNAIDLTYCFRCLDRSHEETLLIRLDWPGHSGLWGIKFNNAYFIDTDPNFPKESNYYYLAKVLDKIKLLDPETDKQLARVVEGSKNQPAEGKPTKLPKKIRHGDNESYTPFSNFKGHH